MDGGSRRTLMSTRVAQVELKKATKRIAALGEPGDSGAAAAAGGGGGGGGGSSSSSAGGGAATRRESDSLALEAATPALSVASTRSEIPRSTAGYAYAAQRCTQCVGWYTRACTGRAGTWPH